MSDSDSSSSSGEDGHAARIAADPFNALHVKECEKERVRLAALSLAGPDPWPCFAAAVGVRQS